MSAELIRCEVRDGVALVTLNNPPLNLVTLALTAELERTLDRLADDPAARVLVLTGTGERAFCAGSDIKEFPELARSGKLLESKVRPENRTYSKVDDFPKPTIAAVRGLAYGGGLELAVCCDLIVAEDDVRLALPEVKLGVFPGSGGPVRVTRRIGEGRAKEMIYFGDPIDAATALGWGLINRVVAKGQALDEAQALARTLAERPNVALQVSKRAIDDSFEMTEEEAIERGFALSERIFQTEDCTEGVRAFFARETPRFSHR